MSCLTNYKQQTIHSTTCLELNDMQISVPQGSVLGSMMYVNDRFDIIDTSHCKMIIYADGTVLFTS